MNAFYDFAEDIFIAAIISFLIGKPEVIVVTMVALEILETGIIEIWDFVEDPARAAREYSALLHNLIIRPFNRLVRPRIARPARLPLLHLR